jgi:hypothetical protein
VVGARTPLQALRSQPRELLAHVAYNARKSVRVLLAVVFGFEHRASQLAVLLLWLAALVTRGERTAAPALRTTARADRAIVAGSLLLLLPVSWVVLVLWRYYLPLLPVAIVASVALGAQGIGALFRAVVYWRRTRCPSGS